MKIDFNEVLVKVLPNFQGGEKEYQAKMVVDDLNKIMYGKLIPHSSIGMHCHSTSSEIMFITKGVGTVICDGVKETVTVGNVHYCPKGKSHTFINETDEDVEFFAVVCTQ